MNKNQKYNEKLGLYCPYCGEKCNGKIIDTRPTFDGRRRRRICEHCGEKFTTIETCVLKVNISEKDLKRLKTMLSQLGGN